MKDEINFERLAEQIGEMAIKYNEPINWSINNEI